MPLMLASTSVVAVKISIVLAYAVRFIRTLRARRASFGAIKVLEVVFTRGRHEACVATLGTIQLKALKVRSVDVSHGLIQDIVRYSSDQSTIIDFVHQACIEAPANKVSVSAEW